MSLSFWIRDYVFFPLMQMGRAVWWRYLCLVISMALFGLWHKATLLFLIWGCYHGVLLVLHRQIEALERRFDWNPPERLWNVASWVITMILMSFGWIFFRAHSLVQAAQMLKAVLSPTTYETHFLSVSLYSLVFAVAIGYTIVVIVQDLLDHHAVPDDHQETAILSDSTSSTFPQTIFRWRWFWIVPLYTLALLFLLIVTLSQGTSTAQLMYGNF